MNCEWVSEQTGSATKCKSNHVSFGGFHPSIYLIFICMGWRGALIIIIFISGKPLAVIIQHESTSLCVMDQAHIIRYLHLQRDSPFSVLDSNSARFYIRLFSCDAVLMQPIDRHYNNRFCIILFSIYYAFRLINWSRYVVTQRGSKTITSIDKQQQPPQQHLHCRLTLKWSWELFAHTLMETSVNLIITFTDNYWLSKWIRKLISWTCGGYVISDYNNLNVWQQTNYR